QSVSKIGSRERSTARYRSTASACKRSRRLSDANHPVVSKVTGLPVIDHIGLFRSPVEIVVCGFRQTWNAGGHGKVDQTHQRIVVGRGRGWSRNAYLDAFAGRNAFDRFAGDKMLAIEMGANLGAHTISIQRRFHPDQANSS